MLILCLVWIVIFSFISEAVLDYNPYEGKFTAKQMEQLVPLIKLGQTRDAEEIGLASKFEFEACNEYLMGYNMVMLRVCTSVYLRINSVLTLYVRR